MRDREERQKGGMSGVGYVRGKEPSRVAWGRWNKHRLLLKEAQGILLACLLAVWVPRKVIVAYASYSKST